jgi:hypothetical protein
MLNPCSLEKISGVRKGVEKINVGQRGAAQGAAAGAAGRISDFPH